MREPVVEHKGLKRLHRARHVCDDDRALHQGRPGVIQVVDQLRGVPRVVDNAENVVPGEIVPDILFDHVVISHGPFGHVNLALIGPALILRVDRILNRVAGQIEVRKNRVAGLAVLALLGKQQHLRRHIAFRPEVQPDVAVLALEILSPQREIAAFLPFRHVHPGGRGRAPDIEMLRLKVTGR